MELNLCEKFLLFLVAVGLLSKFGPTWLVWSVVAVVCTRFIHQMYERQTYWSRRGVPCPAGNPLLGHMVLMNKKGIIAFFDDGLKQYGHTFGCFAGAPSLVTSDIDFLRQALIKNFDCFTDRFNLVTQKPHPRSLFSNFVTDHKGNEWRRVRGQITPAFTTGKLKRLLPAMNACARELVVHLRPQAAANTEVALKDVFSKVTMAVMARAVFGVDVDAFVSEEPELLRFSKRFFNVNMKSPAVLLRVFLPSVSQLYFKLTGRLVHMQDVHDYFYELLEDTYQHRLADPEAKNKYSDFFQLLLNAVDEDGELPLDTEDADIVHGDVFAAKHKRKLSKAEMFAQIIIFLAAGYETTASTFTFVCFFLALHPDAQQRLHDELDAVLGDREEVTYEDLARLQYLSQVIQESNRLCPPAPALNREVTKAVTVNGITLVPGDVLIVPVFSIHHDPDTFPEPQVFDPERFSPEAKQTRDPLTFLTFGAGPRNCIGMRFAEFELRVVLARVLRRFRLEAAADSPKLPLQFEGNALLKPKDELKCKFVPR